jgi:Arc/MetJ-type ribon-helix-helix transcriptional regulator
MKRMRIELPDQLYRQLETLVREGWFRSRQDVVELALRKFLDSHRPEWLEKAIRDDVNWGLHGDK